MLYCCWFFIAILYMFFRTWRNAQFGDIMIQQLESQGLKMAAEKHDYMSKDLLTSTFFLVLLDYE